MKSTSDYRGVVYDRNNPTVVVDPGHAFAFDSAKQFGHDFGGLSVACTQVGTKAQSSLELSTEEMAAQTFAPITVSNLNDLAIAFVSQAEIYFEAKFTAKAAELTPEDSHAMVARAEQAKKDQAAAEAAAEKAESDRKASQEATAAANAELADTLAQIQAAKTELASQRAAAEPPITEKEESK